MHVCMCVYYLPSLSLSLSPDCYCFYYCFCCWLHLIDSDFVSGFLATCHIEHIYIFVVVASDKSNTSLYVWCVCMFHPLTGSLLHLLMRSAVEWMSLLAWNVCVATLFCGAESNTLINVCHSKQIFCVKYCTCLFVLACCWMHLQTDFYLWWICGLRRLISTQGSCFELQLIMATFSSFKSVYVSKKLEKAIFIRMDPICWLNYFNFFRNKYLVIFYDFLCIVTSIC